MGQRVRRDLALSIEVMCEFQKRAELDWIAARLVEDQLLIAEWGAFFSFAFCHSLRGWEVVLSTSRDLRAQLVTQEEGEDLGIPPHIGLPLFGRFKNCGNASVQLLCFMADRTASGLQLLVWAQRLLEIRDVLGWKSDWLFQKEDGSRKSMNVFEPIFFEYLLDIQQQDNAIIPLGLDVIDDFGLSQSFRQGATTRAQNAGVSEADINWVNRWGNATSLIVHGPMRAIYSERSQMLETLLRFSRAL